jgi:hypothetical protein
MKGWHINVEGAYQKDKKMLLEDMDSIDKKGERKYSECAGERGACQYA